MTPLEVRFKYFESLVRIESLSYEAFQQLYIDYMDSPDGTFSEDEHELLADLNDKFDYTAPQLGADDGIANMVGFRTRNFRNWQ